MISGTSSRTAHDGARRMREAHVPDPQGRHIHDSSIARLHPLCTMRYRHGRASRSSRARNLECSDPLPDFRLRQPCLLQYGEMTKALKAAGFERDTEEEVRDDEPENPKSTRMRGTVPAKGIASLLKQRHIRSLLLSPKGSKMPEKGGTCGSRFNSIPDSFPRCSNAVPFRLRRHWPREQVSPKQSATTIVDTRDSSVASLSRTSIGSCRMSAPCPVQPVNQKQVLFPPMCAPCSSGPIGRSQPPCLLLPRSPRGRRSSLPTFAPCSATPRCRQFPPGWKSSSAGHQRRGIAIGCACSTFQGFVWKDGWAACHPHGAASARRRRVGSQAGSGDGALAATARLPGLVRAERCPRSGSRSAPVVWLACMRWVIVAEERASHSSRTTSTAGRR